MFDNLYIQTWKKLLVSFKMYTWFTKKKQQKKPKKNEKTQNIYESRNKVEYL